MNIQWYPGHMKKTRELIQQHIKLVDIVVELLDARAPKATINPQFDDLIGHKKRLIVLNKADLADPEITKQWVKYIETQGKAVLTFNAKTDPPKRLLDAIANVGSFVNQRQQAKGQRARAIRAMVIGIPNVGKSSLINRLIGRSSAKTGDKPGVTRGKQWLRLNGNVDLFDTPGILWPKFEDDDQALRLAFIGSINDDILDRYKLSRHLLSTICENYATATINRYDVACGELDDMMEAIGRRRGLLLKGNQVDYDRLTRMLLDEFRAGQLGRISLERP